jgi:tRNA A58 N-methylase Trm61
MESQGQIIISSERCELIIKTIQEHNCQKIVEIGTWKGMGSSLCILNSMTPTSEFITLESNKTFYEIAKNNLEPFQDKVKIIYGTIVSIDEVNSFVSNLNLDKERQTWLNEDLLNLELCPNVLNEILTEIDFLLLDGGEFSTYREWEKLKSRTKIVALDDIRETKTKQIYLELSKDNDYELIGSTSEGNGFCVFIKK